MALQSEKNIPQIILQVNGLQRTIVYKGIIKDVDDTYWKETFLPKIYPYWDSDRDRLIRFTYYSDGSSFCERKKWVKNFQTNEFNWKDYEFSGYEPKEGTDFYNICTETYFEISQLEKENLQEELTAVYGAINKYTWFTVKLVRKFLLDDSDWVFVEDSPVTQEKKELWKQYRQKLRDIPQEQKDKNAMDVEIPIDPDFYENFYTKDNPGKKYLSTDEQFYRLTNTVGDGFRDRITNYILGKYNIDKSYTDIRSLIGKYSGSDIFVKQKKLDDQEAMEIISKAKGITPEELQLEHVISIAEMELISEKNIKDVEDGNL